jgi:rod shape-determining protein MreB and related proteins
MQGRIVDFFARDVTMDLGTANTQIYAKGRGIVLDEPSVVTLDQKTREIISVGNEAKDLSGRHGPELLTMRPLRNGVISDFEVVSSMMRVYLSKIFKSISPLRRNFVLTVPTDITSVEKRALYEAARKAGAGKIHLIDESIAAAIGSGLRINRPNGYMVVDIGGGTTEVAVVCKFAVVCSKSLRVAGDELDEAICQYMRHQHQVDISDTMAELIKMKIGSVYPFSKKLKLRLWAKEVTSGALKEVCLYDEEIRNAIRKPVMMIMKAVMEVLEKAPPDVTSDVAEQGIWLTGGGALLRGWQRLFYEAHGLQINLSYDPLRATIRGAGEATEQFNFYRHVFHNGKPARFAGN